MIKNKISLSVMLVAMFAVIFLLQTDVLANEITLNDFEIVNDAGNNLTQLKDENTTTGVWFNSSQSITVNVSKNTKGLYFVWEVYPEDGYVISTNANEEIVQNTGFLQEYIAFDSEVSGTITISANSNGEVLEILPVGEGEMPARVHNWEPPLEKADILLLPTHADDEHLYFGPVMPIYADRGDVAIQVAYMVNHNTEPYRNQEKLNGLWVAGVRNYPIVPDFPDVYCSNLAHAKTIYSAEAIIDYQVELIERFEPQIIVAHDFAGEYGHGAHMLNVDCLTQAITKSQVQPKKVYVHLYKENEITLEIDTPLESFGGATAYDVVYAAFGEHNSQKRYFRVEHSGEFDMRKYGLYFSTVGVDTTSDMMENIVSYEEQQRIYEEHMQMLQEAVQTANTSITSVAESVFEIWDDILIERDIQKQAELQAKAQRDMIIIVASSAVVVILALVVAIVLIKRRKRR